MVRKNRKKYGGIDFSDYYGHIYRFIFSDYYGHAPP